uniref:Uncharacterized protein n=1 Tax=Panagrolaimus sp. PS1159 TaxID=55785 RepID=A0AC35G8X9_9BILA
MYPESMDAELELVWDNGYAIIIKGAQQSGNSRAASDDFAQIKISDVSQDPLHSNGCAYRGRGSGRDGVDTFADSFFMASELLPNGTLLNHGRKLFAINFPVSDDEIQEDDDKSHIDFEILWENKVDGSIVEETKRSHSFEIEVIQSTLENNNHHALAVPIGGFIALGSFGHFADNNQDSSAFGSSSGGRGGYSNGRGAGFIYDDNNQEGASRGGREDFGSFGQSNEENSVFGSTHAPGGFNQNGVGGRTCYKCQKNRHTARERLNVESAHGNAEAGTEGGNTQQNNRADGETLPERALQNFIP